MNTLFRLMTFPAGAFFILATCATPALTQPSPQTCDTRDRVLAHLAAKYAEAPVAIGVTNKGALVEVLATSNGSTWTIIVSMPNGTSCIVAAGEGWRGMEREEPAT
jgi:hypothetical protein